MTKACSVIDTNKIGWEILEVPEIDGKIPCKTLRMDEETGVTIWKLKYEKGFTTVEHWHNCSHGIYVLDGTLNTHMGQFGPGSFVWFPEGAVQYHGATQTDDVTLLFITNKSFDITFTHLAGGPPADKA